MAAGGNVPEFAGAALRRTIMCALEMQAARRRPTKRRTRRERGVEGEVGCTGEGGGGEVS